MIKEDRNTAIYTAYEEQGCYDPVVPEKSLLIAVLMNAISDLNKKGPESVRATEYLLSKEDDYLFSFRSVCNYLGVDPKRVLRTVGLDKRYRARYYA